MALRDDGMQAALLRIISTVHDSSAHHCNEVINRIMGGLRATRLSPVWRKMCENKCKFAEETCYTCEVCVLRDRLCKALHLKGKLVLVKPFLTKAAGQEFQDNRISLLSGHLTQLPRSQNQRIVCVGRVL